MAAWNLKIFWSDGTVTTPFAGRNRPAAERQRKWIRKLDTKYGQFRIKRIDLRKV